MTIDVLPDDVFLEIFAIYFKLPDKVKSNLGPAEYMGQWHLLVQVCQRWRQIICGSPRYLALYLYCSKKIGIPVKDLGYWPTFPIVMRYNVPSSEDDVIAILRNSDRVGDIKLWVRNSRWGKVLAAMQEPFPVLTRLFLQGYPKYDAPVLPGGFLGGSAPCLQYIELSRMPFPELPTLLLSARNLVSLRLDCIPPTGYISPEAMVAGLAVLTKLESLDIGFKQWPPLTESRRQDPSMRAILPALTTFRFNGSSEYVDALMAEIDAPRLFDSVMHVDHLPVPQLFQFIGRTEILRFRQVELDFARGNKLDILLEVYPYRPYDDIVPQFFLSTSFDWSRTHVAHIAFILTQTFTICSDVDLLHILVSDDHPGWHDDIDNAEWLAFFRLFPTVKTLHLHRKFAAQVARALEDVPGEIVTEVLPSLHTLILETWDEEELISAEQFASLRQLNGRPITIRNGALDETEEF